MTPDHNESIYAYLSNNLSDEERLNFEEKCLSDIELAEALKVEIKARYAIQQHALNMRKEHYKKSQLFDQPTDIDNKSFFLTSYFKIAAAISIVALSTIILYNYSRNPILGPLELYDQYYQPMTFSVPRALSQDTLQDVEKRWQVVTEAYLRQDWIKVQDINLLLTEKDFEHHDQAHMLLGIAYLELGDTKLAIDNFHKVDTEKLIFKYEVNWYLALAYLKMEDESSASKELQALKSSKTYHSRAQEILKHIGN